MFQWTFNHYDPNKRDCGGWVLLWFYSWAWSFRLSQNGIAENMLCRPLRVDNMSKIKPTILILLYFPVPTLRRIIVTNIQCTDYHWTDWAIQDPSFIIRSIDRPAPFFFSSRLGREPGKAQSEDHYMAKELRSDVVVIRSIATGIVMIISLTTRGGRRARQPVRANVWSVHLYVWWFPDPCNVGVTEDWSSPIVCSVDAD